MLTAEQNGRLSRVGPGTPMGELLRRYWHPISTTGELAENPVRPVRVLGESLTLYQDTRGRLGLIAQRCPHRRVDLKWGIPTDDGLRCPYHGWTFDESGACTLQPAEPESSRFRDKVRVSAYPVAELGGLIWAYLGPAPAPLLPAWRPFTVEGALRHVAVTTIPCNWLQCVENALDPVHAEHLHGWFWEYLSARRGEWSEALGATFERLKRPHSRIAFEPTAHGINKRRILQGQDEHAPDWEHGHPFVFPTAVTLGTSGLYQIEIRTPMDDETTWSIIYQAWVPGHGVAIPEQPHLVTFEAPLEELPSYIAGQDMVVWRDQGAIADRTEEMLGESDRGIILFRRMLEEQMARVERGEEPMNVFRGPDPHPALPQASEEYGPVKGYVPGAARLRTAGPFSPIMDTIDEVLIAGSRAAEEAGVRERERVKGSLDY
jgi:5,5'-dehydrodivanillate O-demethylase